MKVRKDIFTSQASAQMQIVLILSSCFCCAFCFSFKYPYLSHTVVLWLLLHLSWGLLKKWWSSRWLWWNAALQLSGHSHWDWRMDSSSWVWLFFLVCFFNPRQFPTPSGATTTPPFVLLNALSLESFGWKVMLRKLLNLPFRLLLSCTCGGLGCSAFPW